MSHATPATKFTAALTSVALACGAVAPAASAHYGSIAAATDTAPSVPARNMPPRSLDESATAVRGTPTEDAAGSPWVYVGVGGALLSGGLLLTSARRRSRRVGATDLPAAGS
jgi:hypothetical protein